MSYLPKKRRYRTDSDTTQDPFMSGILDSFDSDNTSCKLMPVDQHALSTFNPPDFELSPLENNVPWLERGVSSVARGVAKPILDWRMVSLRKDLLSEYIAAEREITLKRIETEHERSMRQLEYDHAMELKRAEFVQAEYERLDRYEAELAEKGALTAEVVYKLLYLREKLASYARF